MKSIRLNLLIAALLMVFLGAGVWAIQASIARNTQAEISRTLTTIRDTTHLAVKTWFKDHIATGAAWADTQKIQTSAIQLLSEVPDKTRLLNSSAQQTLREWFKTIHDVTRYRGYFIVGPNNINLASSRDQNIGIENLLNEQPGFLEGVWAGNPALSLPVKSDVPLLNSKGELESGLPSMFVAAPIHSDKGEVIAIFMFRLNPEEGFTNALSQGSIGETGETYAFDGKGKLISKSRFDEQLRDIGLISTEENSILNIELRNPGVNLTKGEKTTLPRSKQPLTTMIKSAIKGETSTNLNSYLDYRGVPVVGAWVWDNKIGLGIATEIDAEEAYQTFSHSQFIIIFFTLFSFILLIGLTVIYTLFKERMQVEIELRRAATVFDNTDEGIVVTDSEINIILVNKAFTAITGYKPEEVLGKNPRLQQSGRHDIAFYKVMWDTLINDGQWRGQLWNRKKNGEIYPAWENISIVKNAEGKITNYVAIFSDISVLKESEKHLEHLAHHDNLTGLPNRLRFTANLEQAIESAKRHTQKVALLFLDVDRFKHINDTLGHDIGDKLLIEFSKRLKNCVRAEDTVARLGGDEFTIVLTEIEHGEDACLIADKIVKEIRKKFIFDKHTIDTSTSIGISIFPDNANSYEELMRTADSAMYHAKAAGRNRYQFFNAKLATQIIRHSLIEKGLQTALKNNEFELYYQPQINLNDGKIAGVEALIRWNHPTHGQLLPDTFIKIADDSNLIDMISEWVVRTAMNDYKNWSEKSSSVPRIAVNITGRQISREKSIKHILDLLDELALDPNILQLDLEITETSLERVHYTVDIINTLKKRGVMFAIDDFGTGHSSLSRLKLLPVDTLKIDQSFIHDISIDEDDKAITTAILAMAHSLGLSVIGEGVETKSQLDVLRELGCDEAQGYYYSKPVSANEIEPLLDKTFYI